MKKFGLYMEIGGQKFWVRLFDDTQRIMEFSSLEEAEIFRQQMEFPSSYIASEIKV